MKHPDLFKVMRKFLFDEIILKFYLAEVLISSLWNECTFCV